jgi:hypothetical protein
MRRCILVAGGGGKHSLQGVQSRLVVVGGDKEGAN